jgi:hypothetical protein
LGVNYAVRDGLDAFAGVHRGFVPPGTSPDALPERNLQSEAGFRTVSRWTSAQVVAFHCSYDKLLGADLTALGGSGSGDAFNGGSAYAGGIEFEAVVDLLGRFSGPGRSDELPLQLTYTWTDARFTESFVSTFEPWGTVEAGDRMPYVSPHTASAVIGWQRATWAVDASLRYAAPMGSGDGFTVADAGVRWEFKPGCELRIQGTDGPLWTVILPLTCDFSTIWRKPKCFNTTIYASNSKKSHRLCKNRRDLRVVPDCCTAKRACPRGLGLRSQERLGMPLNCTLPRAWSALVHRAIGLFRSRVLARPSLRPPNPVATG